MLSGNLLLCYSLKRHLLYCFLLSLGTLSVWAQLPDTDALNTTRDSVELYAQLNNLKAQWNKRTTTELLQLNEPILSRLSELNSTKKQFHALLQYSIYLHSRGLLAESSRSLREAWKLAESIDNSFLKAHFSLQVGNMFRAKMPSVALPYYEEAERLYTEVNQLPNLSITLYEYATLLYQNHDFQGSLVKMKAADSVFRVIPNPDLSMKRLHKSGLNTIGLALLRLNRNREALTMFDRALAMTIGVDDNLWKGLIIGNKGLCYLNLGDEKNATLCFQTDMYYSKKFKNLESAASAAMSIAQFHFNNRHLNDTKKYLDSALLWNGGAKNKILSGSYLLLAKWYEAKGVHDQAYAYSVKGMVLNDSIASKIQQAEVVESKSRIDMARQQHQLDLLIAKQDLQERDARIRNLIIVFTILGLIGMGLLALSFYRNTLQKKTHNLLLQESNEEITSQNEKLNRLNAELESQHNKLTVQNDLIERQNETLLTIKENLEDDVTHRTKELTKQYLQFEQFTFMTAHNLRAPVARLLGLTYLFNHDDLTDPVNPQLIACVRANALELDVVLRDLASILEVKKGLNGNFSMLDAEACLRKAQMSLSNEPASSRFSLTSEFSKRNFFGIEPYVVSIFYNLLSNSFKFRKEEKELEISITLKEVDQRIVLEYQDNGIGFDLEAAGENLFKPFKRFHLHREGKGVGLYMIKIQTEAMGGTVAIQSKPGMGFTSVITFQGNS
jgi:signal transduction histidine kinase